jgi:hypothetical protein
MFQSALPEGERRVSEEISFGCLTAVVCFHAKLADGMAVVNAVCLQV